MRLIQEEITYLKDSEQGHLCIQQGTDCPIPNEATDVRSILGSYVPVKDMQVNDAYEINHM